MSVHTQSDKLKLLAMIFEARYEEGYRYLDHSGEMLVRLKRLDPAWVVHQLGLNRVGLVYQEHDLALSIAVEKVDISTLKPVAFNDAEKKARILGDQAAAIYEMIVETLQVPRTTRIVVAHSATASVCRDFETGAAAR
ncbi:MAG: hypothetical protein FJ271_21445 [Planctomycetes bacterium]|nr:hypothetical protein [Planctomycetota bacterium]